MAENSGNRHPPPATVRPRSVTPLNLEARPRDNPENLPEETSLATLRRNHEGVYAPITTGPSGQCPICARPERLHQEGICGYCGFGT